MCVCVWGGGGRSPAKDHGQATMPKCGTVSQVLCDWLQLKLYLNPFLPPKSPRFSLLVGYNM